MLQFEQVEQLRDELSKTTIETILTITGELVAVDMDVTTFRIRSDPGEDYEGDFGEAITREHAAALPARYKATIRKTTKAVLADNEEDVPQYALVALSNL